MLQLTRMASCLQVGARLEQEAAYPGWNPDPSSAVLQLTREVLEELTGQPPKVLPGRWVMETRLCTYLMDYSVTEIGRREEDDCENFLCMCVPDSVAHPPAATREWVAA